MHQMQPLSDLANSWVPPAPTREEEASKRCAQSGMPIQVSPYRAKRIEGVRTNEVEAFSGRITADVKVLLGLREKLNLQDEDIAGLLGLAKNDWWRVSNILEGRASVVDRDKQDRIRFAYQIFRALYDILQDENAVRDWLKENREGFDGEPPLNYMLSGEFEKLLMVRNYTEWLTSR